MIAEEIINRVTPKDENELELGVKMEVRFDLLENEPLFCEVKEKKNLQSVALVLMGHFPEKEYRFSKDKFLIWAKENELLCLESPFFSGFIIKTTSSKYWAEKMYKKRSLKS